jgi:hypothetical protein
MPSTRHLWTRWCVRIGSAGWQTLFESDGCGKGMWRISSECICFMKKRSVDLRQAHHLVQAISQIWPPLIWIDILHMDEPTISIRQNCVRTRLLQNV